MKPLQEAYSRLPQRDWRMLNPQGYCHLFAKAIVIGRIDILNCIFAIFNDLKTQYSFMKSNNINNMLKFALVLDKTAVVKWLVDKGASIDWQTEDGLSPLHLAAKNGNIELLAYLLEKGADLNLKDQEDHSPLDYARAYEATTLAEKMLDLLHYALAIHQPRALA
jgi:ankyrin repeat protein